MISYLFLESCFHASAPFYHAFMHLRLSFMLSCFFSAFVWLFSFYFFKKIIKKKEKSEKIQKQYVYVYIGTCVPWMAIETKFSRESFCSSLASFYRNLDSFSIHQESFYMLDSFLIHRGWLLLDRFSTPLDRSRYPCMHFIFFFCFAFFFVCVHSILFFFFM